MMQCPPLHGVTLTFRKPRLAAKFGHESLAGGDGGFFWPVFRDLSFQWLPRTCPSNRPAQSYLICGPDPPFFPIAKRSGGLAKAAMVLHSF